MFFTSIDANTARAYAELVNRQIAEKTTDEEHRAPRRGPAPLRTVELAQ